MPAPNIAAITKYTSRGKTDVYWVETMVDYTAPTRAELDAGTNLKNLVTASEGWNVETARIPVQTLGSRETPTLPGEVTFTDSSLTMLMDEQGVDARSLLTDDTEGYIVWLYGGDVEGNKMSVFPVTVASQSPQISVDGSAPDTMMFSFAITSNPARNLAVPAEAP